MTLFRQHISLMTYGNVAELLARVKTCWVQCPKIPLMETQQAQGKHLLHAHGHSQHPGGHWEGGWWWDVHFKGDKLHVAPTARAAWVVPSFHKELLHLIAHEAAPLKSFWTPPLPELYCDRFIFLPPPELVNLVVFFKTSVIKSQKHSGTFSNLASTHSPAGAVHAVCDLSVFRPPSS